jgi:periplasmic protein TonB
MTATMDDLKAIQRRYRKRELTWEDQVFLRILSTFGLTAWVLVLWSMAFPPIIVEAPKEQEIQVAKLILKPPPPPPEPEKVEPEKPKPQPLPPRANEKQKIGPPPGRKDTKVVKAPAPAGAPKATAKRSVATMGLLSVLSSSARPDSASQRIGPSLQNVDFREARDLTEDVSSLTGTVGARDKVGIGQMVAGLPRGSGTNVVLKGSVVTPVTGPGGASVGGTGSGDGVGAGGSRTLSEIRDIVASYIAGLKYLYDRELKARPSLHGKVTVEFVVTAPGQVQGVRLVNSGLGHPSLESAILGRIRGWKFPPKPGDETRVTFPFDFVPPTT